MKIGQTIGERTIIAALGPINGKLAWSVQCRCGLTQTRTTGQLNRASSCRKCATVKANKSRAGTQNSKYTQGQVGLNTIYSIYKHAAGRRGLGWEISKAAFKTLTSKNCHYCNDIPRNIHTPKGLKSGDETRALYNSYTYNGLDRVDNFLGYETTNVVPCCKICNIAKATLGVAEFLDWVKRVYRHSVEGKT